MVDGDQAEEKRRLELSRYAPRLLATFALTSGLCSVLEEIENRSQALLAKGNAARFLDKGEDSKEVAKLIKQLQEAITHYQVSEDWIVVLNAVDVEEKISQQQAIYNQITNLTVRIPQLIVIR